MYNLAVMTVVLLIKEKFNRNYNRLAKGDPVHTTTYVFRIIVLELSSTGFILLHAHPQVVYCSCVKFYQN